ncbi:hypothetical protein AX17_000975 [Amanita inopinata Kibby_2008]|nr:hypothetical protein AX17_000975 [Amanita inopinata Kibby_2008]
MFPVPQHHITVLFRILLLGDAGNAILVAFAWVIRIAVFLFLLRTYLIPWLLALTSKHIRLRTISLRSIRGLYIHTGAHVCRVERISYVWSNVSGSRRITIKVEGLNLEISNRRTEKPTRHKRTLTLADLSPSPLARRIWDLLGDVYGSIEPYFRPYIRAWVVAYLRFFIRWLPRISRAVSFDLPSIVVTLPDVQRTEIIAESIHLHTLLSLTPSHGVGDGLINGNPRRGPVSTTLYGMAAWRKRFKEGFQRSLDLALGEAKGTAAISLQLQSLNISTLSDDINECKPLIQLPGLLELNVSVCFNPRAGRVDEQSLESTLKVGDCVLHADSMLSFIDELGKPEQSHFESVAPFLSSKRGSLNDQPELPTPNLLSPPITLASPSMSPFESPFLSPLLSSKVPSISSLTSPTSPLLEAISASLRSRRHRRLVPCQRLKDAKCNSVLSFLQRVRVMISRVSVAYITATGQSEHSYRTIIQDISFDTSRSLPGNNPYHAELLGRRDASEFYDPEAYNFRLSIVSVKLERHTIKDVWNVFTIGATQFQALASQWPFPWLTTTPFLCSDPNASVLALRGHFDSLTITERLEDLHLLVSQRITQRQHTSVEAWQMFKAFPRVVLEFSCGPLTNSVVCKAPDGYKPLVVELKTNGFLVSASSCYLNGKLVTVPAPDFPFEHEIQMQCDLSLVVEPIFVLVHPNAPETTSNRFPGLDLLYHPTAVSVEAIDARCQIGAAAGIDDRVGAVACVDTSTLTFDAHICSDAVCLELWHPDVVAATLQLLTALPLDRRIAASGPLKSSPVIVPCGISLSAGLARLVLFVTAPDLNPHDDLGLSRGVALRTAVSLHWCSLARRHLRLFGDLYERCLIRQELELSREICVDVVTALKGRGDISLPFRHLLKLAISNLLLRGAVATLFEADDPLMAEHDGSVFNDQDFLCVDRMDLTVSSGSQNSGHKYQASINIPVINISFHLSHIYEMMLALQTLRSLQQVRSHSSSEPSGLALQVDLNVASVQITWTLPEKELLSNVHSLSTRFSVDKGIHVHFDGAQLCVPSATNPHIGRYSRSRNWEELANLQMWDVHILPPLVSAHGKNAQLKIPFGYIFADLIFDMIVVSKAFRHIVRIATAGSYQEFPAPEPEGPKIVPQVKIDVGHFSLEASDDAFESRLGVIWRVGSDAVRQRLDREKAFHAKVAAIYAAESGTNNQPVGHEYHFNASHTIPVEEARQRLDEVHALDWTFRVKQELRKTTQAEQSFIYYLRSTLACTGENSFIPGSNAVDEIFSPQMPPLFRIVLFDLRLQLSVPSFGLEHLPDFLYEQGDLPRDTAYSLLVPMHLHFTLSAMHATLRDYPLPLISIPAPCNGNQVACEFDTDIVFAEEMGSEKSVDWIECPLILQNQGAQGVLPLSVTVPKTIMPVKSYANPVVKVTTDRVTTFSWGVSYGPVIQDLMRVIDTLSSSSRDDSPPIGFWDKLKLVFHWSFKISFQNEVVLHMKGSRDPYDTTDVGAGFVLLWQGNTRVLVNRQNEDKELIQVLSNTLIFAIPDLDEVAYNQPQDSHSNRNGTTLRKICAKFQSGVRFGVGFVLERSCGDNCSHCTGPAFQRRCRFFDFLPHYMVKLEKKTAIPDIKSPDDSYNEFRSDFVHLSISLVSSLNANSHQSSSFHLTPKSFAHFWSWWSLFDSALSLPVRQGTYYPRRIVTPKLGRHLATIKYRLSVPHLSLTHAYLDDGEETWTDGVTPWIGLKGMVDHLQADFHQRDEEATVSNVVQQAAKNLRRKAFYAAEVMLRGVDLRALLATFSEPQKQTNSTMKSAQQSNYKTRKDLPITELSSLWYDPADFIETDWSSTSVPKLHILPIASCPYFLYFKRNTALADSEKHLSKFGVDDSHSCLLGTEPSIYNVQIDLAKSRIVELEQRRRVCQFTNPENAEGSRLDRMITLLQEYISLLPASYTSPDASHPQNYLMPSETISSSEWAEFDNVYQVHCPKLYLDAPIRDILMRYYHCSRARRGFEYHLATRAVKFIRDQANTVVTAVDGADLERSRSPTQAAASALRKILKGDNPKSSAELDCTLDSLDTVNPLAGWSEGVSLKKSHCCLLLKPQVVLQGEADSEACIVAAVQAKLQSFAIMDDLNAHDPISGKVMSRNYTALLGLQAFSPSSSVIGKACVPLEVLVDLKCESDEFDRLVPQTDAVFHYDKFNRLRLRNIVNTAVTRASKDSDRQGFRGSNHLCDQTDLLRIHIPRFTVLASDKHFQSIASNVSELLLFSDVAHKTRLERLESLLIRYDFTDLSSAATVVENLQRRLRTTLEGERQARLSFRRSNCHTNEADLLNVRAHVHILAEELHLLFDAIRLAQDRSDGRSDRKSALLLHASSSVISWNMLADERNLISKLEVQDTNFHWLSRRDSSTVNNLTIGNLQAFDGSQHAQWAEILSKHDVPATHPLLKQGLFLVANWIILAPVGGITIYETFELSLHPIRLQIDAKVGRRIMEYLWPARKDRHGDAEDDTNEAALLGESANRTQDSFTKRTSLDSSRALQTTTHVTLAPPLRKLGTSRSFSDLRAPKHSDNLRSAFIHSNRSVEALGSQHEANKGIRSSASSKRDVAAEMKNRSAKKTFILVKILSLDILLSILKEGSFECHDARIKTRQLEYHNQTWNFEDLFDQFIPSDMTWRGWVKMALHQPLIPVLPVARELLLKTKLIAARSGAHTITNKDSERDALTEEHQRHIVREQPEVPHPFSTLRKVRRKQADIRLTSLALSAEPERAPDAKSGDDKENSRRHVLSIFGRGTDIKGRGGTQE